MKKVLVLFMLAVFGLILLTGCGGSKQVSAEKNPYLQMQKRANEFNKNGAVAVVGQGESSREDIARKKSYTDARANLADALEAKVQTLSKSFLEEVGTSGDSEINEAFSRTTKVMSSSVLKGSFPEDEVMVEKEGKITIYTLMVINPATFNQSLLDEMNKSGNKKLYERFRASQAYDELNNEMEKYEESNPQPSP
ncbi:MAG: hypothetical protein U9R41_06115 [Candidatus Marinimicrobia bacterium]|nr:hypothetical protein [Candidatus Neomarinimicrobiota bacterium]